MASKTSKPGLKALETRQDQVIIAIKNNLGEVAKQLRDESILLREDYEDATSSEALMPKSTRVQLVFEKLTGMVNQNDNHFVTFVKILHTTNSKETVEMLIQTYVKQGGNIKDVKHILSGKTPKLLK